jgi:hypothetical protein
MFQADIDKVERDDYFALACFLKAVKEEQELDGAKRLL